MSDPVVRCRAAVPRRLRDFDGDWIGPEVNRADPLELVTDQCRRAACKASGEDALCATHLAKRDGFNSGTINPPIPYLGKGHWEWVSDE